MAFHCLNYEEFSSGRCTKDRNPCLVNTSNNSGSDGKELQCLRMGFNSDIGWKNTNQLNDDSEAGIRTIGRTNTGVSAAQNNGQTSRPTSSGLMYFLQTSDQTPYCRYHYRIKLRLKTRNDLATNPIEKGRLFIQIFGTRSSTPVLEATKE